MSARHDLERELSQLQTDYARLEQRGNRLAVALENCRHHLAEYPRDDNKRDLVEAADEALGQWKG